MAHSNIGPSAAHRWTRCLASVEFIDQLRAEGKIPKEDSSVYADEGTRAHAAASAILTGAPVPEFDDAEMKKNVEDYVTWIRSWHTKDPGMSLWVERRVDLFYLPESYGTVDAVVWGAPYIFVGDLKYGAGVSVQAENNDQLAIYAESVIREVELAIEVPDSMPVTLGIFQPRDRNNPEPVRLWEMTRGELRAFCMDIGGAASSIVNTRGVFPFVADPEKQCRFCPAKAHCKAYASYGLTVVTDDVDKLPATALPSPNELTREQRQKVIAASKPLKKWLEEIEEQEKNDLLAGLPPIHFKLVAGKSNRQWTDEGAAEKLLGNYLKHVEMHPPSDLISVTQAEKLLKGVKTSTRFDNALEKLITKPEGKPTLVPIDDKRPALNSTEGLTAIPSIEDV